MAPPSVSQVPKLLRQSVRYRTDATSDSGHCLRSLTSLETLLSLGTLLLIVLVLILLGVLPIWPHSRRMGYAPSGAISIVLVVLVVLVLTGRIG